MFAALENLIQSNYLPERELKNGERGTVFLLREKETGRRHVLHRFRGSSEVYECLRGVECSCLPRVEAVAEKDGHVLVLEEYIQGDTLAFLLEERPLNEEQAREILIQVCRALKELHSLGVVHRDVKPENIILRGDEAVLIDFDVSRVSKPERNTDTRVMGTTGYAAPEQFGFSQTDARADIFALGVLMNEMLTRQHPARELAAGALRPVIEKCIEVNVDKRYSSVEELLRALTAPQAKRLKRRKQWLLLPVVVLFAVLLAIPRLGSHLAEWTAERFQKEAQNQQDNPLQKSKVAWHGDSEVYGTLFYYDLDGDGAGEEYLFAAMYNFVDEPRLLQHSGSAINDKPEVLEVVPAVWVETGEETYAPVDAFAALLTDSAVNLRQIEGEHEGVVEEIGALYGLWPGAIRATFEHVGRWYYECSAELNGEVLTAVGSTQTELFSEATASVEPYITEFQYDLDGDGTYEQYWFGVASQMGNGEFPLFHDATNFYEGSGSERTVAPVVWRQIGRDTYEQVPKFASLLENPQVNLRCEEGNVQPNVSVKEDLFGVWSGTIEVIFTHDGTWVYECSAVLDGTELTAAAVTQVETRPPGT